jgi:hypothetical protein
MEGAGNPPTAASGGPGNYVLDSPVRRRRGAYDSSHSRKASRAETALLMDSFRPHKNERVRGQESRSGDAGPKGLPSHSSHLLYVVLRPELARSLRLGPEDTRQRSRRRPSPDMHIPGNNWVELHKCSVAGNSHSSSLAQDGCSTSSVPELEPGQDDSAGATALPGAARLAVSPPLPGPKVSAQPRLAHSRPCACPLSWPRVASAGSIERP